MSIINTKESLAEKQQGLKIGSRVRTLFGVGNFSNLKGEIVKDSGFTWEIKFDDGRTAEVKKSQVIKNSAFRPFNVGDKVRMPDKHKTGVIVAKRQYPGQWEVRMDGETGRSWSVFEDEMEAINSAIPVSTNSVVANALATKPVAKNWEIRKVRGGYQAFAGGMSFSKVCATPEAAEKDADKGCIKIPESRGAAAEEAEAKMKIAKLRAHKKWIDEVYRKWQVMKKDVVDSWGLKNSHWPKYLEDEKKYITDYINAKLESMRHV